MKTVIDCGDDKNAVFLQPYPSFRRIGAQRKYENSKAKNYTQSENKGDYSLQRYPLKRLIRVKSLNKEGLIIIFIIIFQPINIC